MWAREKVVGRKLKLKGKAAKIRKTKKLHKNQKSKVLAAGSRKGKESNANNQKTCYDGFLSKQVPVRLLIESQELGPGGCGACGACGAWDHFHLDCPCLKYFPKGTQIGFHYETICLGCDRIGEVCCNKGGFAVMKVCAYCCGDGHWQWEDCEDCTRPKDLVFEKPKFFYKIEDAHPSVVENVKRRAHCCPHCHKPYA